MTTYTNTIASQTIHESDVGAYDIFSGITPTLEAGDTLDYVVTENGVHVKSQWTAGPRTADAGTYVFTYSVSGTNPQTIAQTRTLYVYSQDSNPATVQELDSNTTPATGDGTPDGGDAHDLTGDNTFESTAIVGLTSSIDEFVHIGREQLMQVFEEALGDIVVLQVECNINAMLETAGVRAPHNESISTTATDDKIDLAALGRFEWLLKSQDGGTNMTDKWALLKGTTGTQGNPQKQLYQQVRSFLGDFFDHDKELNAIVAQTSTSEPRALVLLDDDKIKSELANLKNNANADGTAMPGEGVLTTYDSESDKQPRDRKCFATNLLSVRQMAQVLEAFAAMGIDTSNSRIIRETAKDGSNYLYYDPVNDPQGNITSTTQDTGYEPKASGAYLYKLHNGDSIIGECKVYDSDAVSTSKQYSQVIKVQIVQSLYGSYEQYIATEGPLPSILGGDPNWTGDADRVKSASVALKAPAPTVARTESKQAGDFVEVTKRTDGEEALTDSLAYTYKDMTLNGVSVSLTDPQALYTFDAVGEYKFYVGVSGTFPDPDGRLSTYEGTSAQITVSIQ